MHLLSQQQDGSWQLEAASLPNWEEAQSILLDVADEPDEDMLNAHNIGIEFPAFNDGRGLSLAVLLRTRFNFRGDIYAIGAVHQDILHYMVRCGFNKIVCPADCDPQVALSLLQPYSQHYQGSVVDSEPSFKRVERGRNA